MIRKLDGAKLSFQNSFIAKINASLDMFIGFKSAAQAQRKFWTSNNRILQFKIHYLQIGWKIYDDRQRIVKTRSRNSLREAANMFYKLECFFFYVHIEIKI